MGIGVEVIPEMLSILLLFVALAFSRSETSASPMKAGNRVRFLDDGKVGILQNPRGCFCGENGEACWDVAYEAEPGGVQAHGGTFELIKG